MATKPAASSTVIILLTHYFPPSLNRVGNHWIYKKNEKKRAMDQLWAACHQQYGTVPRFTGPVQVKIVRLWGYRQRELDEDNINGAVKPLIDAMRERRRAGGNSKNNVQGGLGIIENDSPKFLSLTIEQYKHKVPEGCYGIECTHIEITGKRIV